jgi:hypothetical protein
VQIPNNSGLLDSTFRFTWKMLVKPASITGNGVIFETSFDGKRAVKI